MLKSEAVHLVCGLSSAAKQLSEVTNSGVAINQLLSAVAKITKAIADAPADSPNLVSSDAEKSVQPKGNTNV